jgi:hypothetical protein
MLSLARCCLSATIDSVKWRETIIMRFRHRSRRATARQLILAASAALASASIGCSSHSSVRTGLTPLPEDQEAIRMLLEPHDLPDEHWVPGGRPDPIPPPKACAPTPEGQLVGRASVELENLSSSNFTQAGFYEYISIFDTHAAAVAWITQVLASQRCAVDMFNRGELESNAMQSWNATYRALPALPVGDHGIAWQIVLESTSPPGFSTEAFLQRVAFIEDSIAISVSAHSLEVPLDDRELENIVQAALRKERSARGISPVTTPTP